VRVAASQTLVHSVRVKQIAGGTGKAYFGLLGMNKGTLVGVIKEIPASQPKRAN